jgi:plastocyanin
MRRVALLLILLAALAACSSGGGAEPGTVTMSNSHRFEPATITIKVGDTVGWKNTSNESHTVTAVQELLPEGAEYFASGGFSSEAAAADDLAGGLIDPGENYEATFDVPGTYKYYCIPHRAQGMEGTVIVQR